MERPSAIPDDYEEYCKLMMDLQVIAWQTDMTRVASFMLGRDGSNRPIARSASRTGIIRSRITSSDPERVEKLIKIDELHVAAVRVPPEAAEEDAGWRRHACSTIRSCVFGSSLSESNLHTHDDLPIRAGRQRGRPAEGQPSPRRTRRKRRSTTCS